jgi:MFS family permease
MILAGMQDAGQPTGVTIRSILAEREVRHVVLLGFGVLFSVGLVFPILPLFVRSFGAGYGDVGLFVTIWALARLSTDLLAGSLIQRVGERRAAVIGLALISVGGLATGLAPTYAAAAACYALSGVGSALSFAAMFSHLLRLVGSGSVARTLSIFYGAFNLGIVGGAFAGGFIAHSLGVEAPFLFTAGVAAICALLYLRLLPAAPAPGRPEEGARGLQAALRLVRAPGFAVVLTAQFAYLWMIAAIFDTLVPLYADSIGVSAAGIGIIFAVALAVELAVLYPAGVFADRRGRRFVLVPALIALAASTATLGLTGSAIVLGIAMALFGIGSGVAGVPPGAMLSDVTPEGQTGLGVGLFRFVGDLGFVFGPLVAGFAADGLGFPIAFALVAAPTVLAIAMFAGSPETLGRAERAA